jgi:hypothetical protein
MTKAAELAKMGEVLTNSQIGGRRNIVYNGKMQVAQRGTSETGVGATAGYFTCDRWVYSVAGSHAGRFTMTQTADGPSGFASCLKLDCTTADTSIAAGELAIIRQHFEGQDLQQIKKGTSDAEQLTVSFYVKASSALTFGLELFDSDNDRQITKLFTTTTSWVRHEITFPADTTGAFNNDTERSLDLSFWIHAGSTYAGGTLNSTAFASTTTANRAAGIDSFFSSTDNEFFLTGVQMELGSVATPFEHRSFGEEYQLCQRYYQEITGSVDNSALEDAHQAMFPMLAYNTTLGLGTLTFITPMRGRPALGYSAVGHFLKYSAGRGDNVTGLALYDGVENATTRTAYINVTSGTSTAGGGFVAAQNTAARLNFDAEL